MINFCRITKAQKEGKSDSELDEMWWKQAGELVAGYYKQRAEVEKDVEGADWAYRLGLNGPTVII